MKKLFKSLLILAMLTLFFSSTALANSEGGMKVFDKKTNIKPNKQWTIKLNMDLDSNSIVNNVYVNDNNGNKINVSINLGIDGKSIIVQAPREGYKYGETYTLQIKSSLIAIKAKSGKALNQDASMEFTIKTDPNAATPEVRGNTSGNINNEGLMVQSGDWIYYSNPYGEGLYKMKSDGTSKTLLSKDNPKDINVIGEWIYFTTGDLELYKINTNGDGKVKLIEDMVDNILVVNDWIYYVSLTNYGEEFICKVKIDGSSKTVIARGRNYTFDVSNGWIYYTQYNNGLYKVKTDGTGKTTLIEGLKPSKFVVDKGYVYYYDKSDEGRLYRISVNGTDKSKLSDNDIGNPNVIGDYVFYINFNDSQSKRVLHRVKVDGTGDKAIDDTPILWITSVGDWIYCTTQDNKVFKIKPDGTGKQFITN